MSSSEPMGTLDLPKLGVLQYAQDAKKCLGGVVVRERIRHSNGLLAGGLLVKRPSAVMLRHAFLVLRFIEDEARARRYNISLFWVSRVFRAGRALIPPEAAGRGGSPEKSGATRPGSHQVGCAWGNLAKSQNPTLLIAELGQSGVTGAAVQDSLVSDQANRGGGTGHGLVTCK